MAKTSPRSPSELADIFTAAVSKRISNVESQNGGSNQHEFNGTRELKALLGTKKLEGLGSKFFYFDDNGEVYACDGELTWYDARESHPKRTEWRLYYKTNEVTKRICENDLMVIARRKTNDLVFIVAQGGDLSEQQLRNLFALQDIGSSFSFIQSDSMPRGAISELHKRLLMELEIIPSQGTGSPDLLEEILSTFGEKFPRSSEFSAFARERSRSFVSLDQQIMEWYRVEQRCFEVLEKYLVEKKLQKGFEGVEEFIEFSLSVQNRRKSRAGYALENHLEFLFEREGIENSRTEVTEGSKRPDFIFPNIKSYRDLSFDSGNLSMLGVKTSCKDRWRQILNEADRIKGKHLLTLEPGISSSQMLEMYSANLTLVVPEELHKTYPMEWRDKILTVRAFSESLKKTKA